MTKWFSLGNCQELSLLAGHDPHKFQKLFKIKKKSIFLYYQKWQLSKLPILGSKSLGKSWQYSSLWHDRDSKGPTNFHLPWWHTLKKDFEDKWLPIYIFHLLVQLFWKVTKRSKISLEKQLVTVQFEMTCFRFQFQKRICRPFFKSKKAKQNKE